MSEVAEVWLTEVVSVVGEELESCSTVVCTAEASALAAGLTETVSLCRLLWWLLPHF